jgi:hypothetical protein
MNGKLIDLATKMQKQLDDVKTLAAESGDDRHTAAVANAERDALHNLETAASQFGRAVETLRRDIQNRG